MYAVIRSGGKQHRVRVGDVVRVEKLDGDKGAAVLFEDILAVGEGESMKIGTPNLPGAQVKGTVIAQDRSKKIIMYQFKHRQNANRKRRGHRQDYTAVRIDAIQG